MKRESFKSRLGFLLVRAGCAIGIGNVWRFPYVAGQNGGGLFVLLYLIFLVIMGLPVLTMELHPGDALPTAADLNAQLPTGYTVTTLTWADNAAAVPGGATEMTLTELKISGTENRCQITGGAVVIDGTAYTAKSYFNTLTLTDITLPVKSKGVTVSGTVTSYGDAGENVTVQLIEAGHPEPAYEDIVSGNSAAYSFPTVPAGTYTLKVMKKGHAPWTESITVGDGNVTKDVTVYLYGDVNRNGTVTVLDASWIRQHLVGKKAFDEYQLQLADVNKSGNISVLDASWIRQRLVGIRNEYYEKIN